jgi:hypothetical protein
MRSRAARKEPTGQEIAAEYYEYPKDILKSVEKFGSAFLHKYPNLDNVLNGMDLIDRPRFVANVCDSLLVFNVSPSCRVKTGDHVFLGAIRVKGVAMAYVHSRDGDCVFIGAMSSEKEE